MQTKLDQRRVVVIGAGRLGTAMAPALRSAGLSVRGPVGRGYDRRFRTDEIVMLCVPDSAIADVASSIDLGPLIGHCSGALSLAVLGDHRAFSMHPLLSITSESTAFEGAACAVAGRDAETLAIARELATAMGMTPIHVPDDRRALYHAAASMASNYLVTIEDAADQLARSSGIERKQLARLAQSALDNWARFGGPEALTGPIARGDEATVAGQRAAVQQELPGLLPLWDALATATRELSKSPRNGDA